LKYYKIWYYKQSKGIFKNEKKYCAVLHQNKEHFKQSLFEDGFASR